MKLDNFKESIKDNYLVATAFIVSTLLMLYQHSTGWSWDFAVYSMSGDYLFHNGIYMEWLRPPVASIMMGLLQFVFSRNSSEYIFIVLVSGFFLYSAYRASKQYDLNLNYFYPLTLTPVAIFFATSHGTEMLSLAFAMMFFSTIEKRESGFWLGMAFLTRYTYGILIPLVLIETNVKESVEKLVISAIPVTVWLAINWAETGNPFTSFMNYLAVNVFLRVASEPLNPANFVIIGLPTILVIHFYFKDKMWKEKIFSDTAKKFLVIYTALNTFIYLSGNFKPLRYLYPLLLPIGYISTKVISRTNVEKLLYLLVGLNLVFGGIAVFEEELDSSRPYRIAVDYSSGCMTESNAWALINYGGTPSYQPLDTKTSIERAEKGYRVIEFRDEIFGELNGSEKPPLLYQENKLKIYGYENRCAEPKTANQTYLERYELENGYEVTPKIYLELITGLEL